MIIDIRIEFGQMKPGGLFIDPRNGELCLKLDKPKSAPFVNTVNLESLTVESIDSSVKVIELPIEFLLIKTPRR